MGRARLPQHDRGASRLSRWRPARSAAGAPTSNSGSGSMVLRRFASGSRSSAILSVPTTLGSLRTLYGSHEKPSLCLWFLCLVRRQPWPAVWDSSTPARLTSPSTRGHERAHGHVGLGQRGSVGSSCTDFKWTVDRADVDDRQGIVQRDVPDDLMVAGTAEASLSGSTIAWSAAGNATGPASPRLLDHPDRHRRARHGFDSRAVLGRYLSGKVSGVEILKKR